MELKDDDTIADVLDSVFAGLDRVLDPVKKAAIVKAFTDELYETVQHLKQNQEWTNLKTIPAFVLGEFKKLLAVPDPGGTFSLSLNITTRFRHPSVPSLSSCTKA
jgi:hypothetical protein